MTMTLIGEDEIGSQVETVTNRALTDVLKMTEGEIPDIRVTEIITQETKTETVIKEVTLEDQAIEILKEGEVETQMIATAVKKAIKTPKVRSVLLVSLMFLYVIIYS